MKRRALYVAVPAAALVLGLAALGLYARSLRSRLAEEALALRQEARAGYRVQFGFPGLLEAGSGILYAEDTRREIDALWGKEPSGGESALETGAVLLGFIRVNKERLSALREVLSAAPAGEPRPYPLSVDEARLAWWAWRLLGTAALLSPGDEGGAMADLLRCFRIYRALSTASSIEARRQAVLMLKEGVPLARKVIRSLPEGYEPGKEWNALAGLIAEAWEDYPMREEGAAKLLRAEYLETVLEKASEGGFIEGVMLCRVCTSREREEHLSAVDLLLRERLRAEREFLSCMAAGLSLERAARLGREPEPFPEEWAVSVNRDEMGRTVVVSAGGEARWVVEGRGGQTE